MWKNAAQLLLCILLCQAAGAIGVVSTDTGSSPWYQALRKPWFNPPGWIFGPVWTLLYLMMGIALFIVWRRGWELAIVRWALLAFAIQWVLNAAWTPVFFGAHWPVGGLLVIVPMWLAIGATVLLFWHISPAAGLLLLPYWAWVSFATLLNSALVYLNRGG